MPRTRVAWALLAVSLLAVSAPGAAPGAREDGAAAGHGHPSCAVGRLLARQADLGEAVLALEICRRHAPSVAAVRNLAAAYIDTGRTALARQTLLQLVEDGRSGPDELCRARLSLAELRMADGGGRCDLLRVELDAADEACREASGQAFAQDLLRVRAEAHLECSNASTDDADAERAVARAAAAHRPASARSWRTLCFTLLLHESQSDLGLEGDDDAHPPRASTNSSRCWDALGRLQDRSTPPWACQLLAAVALTANGSSAGQSAAAARVRARYRFALRRVRLARALVGWREVQRLLGRSGMLTYE